MPKTPRANAGEPKSVHNPSSFNAARKTSSPSAEAPDAVSNWVGQLQGNGSQTAFEQHVALLGDSRFSQAANAGLRAQIVRRLQSDYGNGYVQRLVDHVTRKPRGAPQPDQPTSRPNDFYLQAAQRLSLHSNQANQPLQTKLIVGPAGDKYEKQADKVAKQVVGRTRRDPLQSMDAASKDLHRDPSTEIEEEESLEPEQLDMQLDGLTSEEADELLQAKRQDAQRQVGLEGGPVDSDVEQSIQASKGNGRVLPDNFRQSMESSFGADFSGVRVHSDSKSDSLNQNLNSHAFTVGRDIFVRRQDYSPTTTKGQELLAHELTHVIQQDSGTARRNNLPIQRADEEGSKTGVMAAGGWLVDKAQKGFGWVSDHIDKYSNEIKKGIQKKLSAGWKTVRKKFPWIAVFLEGLLGLVVNPIQLGWAGLKLVAKIAWFILKSTGKSLIGNIGKVIDIVWKLISGKKWAKFNLFEDTRAWFKDWDQNKLNPILWGEFLGVWTGNARDVCGWFALLSGLFGLIPGAQVLLGVSTVMGAITLALSGIAAAVSGATLFANIIHWWTAVKEGKPVAELEKRLKRLSALSVGDLGSLAGSLIGLSTEILPSETAKQATGAFIGGFTEGVGDMAKEGVEEKVKKDKKWTEIWSAVREKGGDVWEELFKNIHRIGRLIGSVGKIFMAGFKAVSMVLGGIATVIGGVIDIFASVGRKVKTGEWNMEWTRSSSIIEGIKDWNDWEKDSFFPGFWGFTDFTDDLMKWVTKEKGNVFKKGGKTLTEFLDIQDKKREG